MKKLYPSIFLFFAFTQICHSQQHKGLGVTLRTGISKVYNVSSCYDSGTSPSYIPNYGLGVFYDLPVGNDFTFRPQISFLNRSWRGSSFYHPIDFIVCPNSNNITRDFFISHEFTVLYQFKDKKLKPLFQLGLRGDVYLDTHTTQTDRVPTTGYWEKNEEYRTGTVTAIVGVGINKNHWELMLELNPSLMSFTNYRKTNIHSLNLIMGYRF